MYQRRGLSALVNVYAADESGNVVDRVWVDDPTITALEQGGAGCADLAGVWHYPCGAAPAAAPSPGPGAPAGGSDTVICPDDHDNCHRMVERIGHCEGQLVRILSAEGPGCDIAPGAVGAGGGFPMPIGIPGVPSWAVYVGAGLLVYLLLRR
jgi:hypothetical protein